MSGQGFAIFDTALGACGIAWGPCGVTRVLLPDGGKHKLRARLQRRFPQASEAAPPPDIARIVADIVALMQGEARDFGYAALDLAGVPDFNRRVFDIART